MPAPSLAPCGHIWRRVDDAEGDLSEPQLTEEVSYWECVKCGQQELLEPPDLLQEFDHAEFD